MAERAALTDLGLDAWLAEPDEHGWPPLGPSGTLAWSGGTLAWSAGITLISTRRSQDQHRGLRTPLAALWRREHPTWRPGMDPDAADAFDLRLAEALAGASVCQ
jgi:hypothetical protein